ncbi:hypothetical protein MIR68_009058 [Amoeboaphelidium protococcarum]|nr:hypothetical protein MIR68_009058 [Amoeboaphelidium protococcarum]
MNFSVPISTEIEGLSFSFIDSNNVKALSVKRIDNPVTFDPTTRQPTDGGLYDPQLGPTDKQQLCSTCKLNFFSCAGHFGHIELTVPAYHPLLFKMLFTLLKSTCLCCHSFKMKTARVARHEAKLQLLHNGCVLEALEMDGMDFSLKTDPEDLTPVDEEFICANIQKYVKKSIKNHKNGCGPSNVGQKTMLANDVLRLAVKEFLSLAQAVKKCENCGAKSPTLRKEQNTKIFQQPLSKKDQAINAAIGMKSRVIGYDVNDDDDDDLDESNNDHLLHEDEDDSPNKVKGIYLTPVETKEHLRRLYEKEQSMLNLLFGSVDNSETGGHRVSSFEHFFMEVVAVPPNKFRPISKMGDKQFDHAQNGYLTEIIKHNNRIVELRQESKQAAQQSKDEQQLAAMAGADQSQNSSQDLKDADANQFRNIINAWVLLQENLNNLIDSTKNPKSKVVPPGIKQILEKKEGLFRKNMMGKRVNFAARSVISPDPMIQTSEIGIPMVFARKLTYPEPVTPFNMQELRKAIINGPNTYPGAVSIQNEDGSLIMLTSLSKDKRIAVANSLLTPSSSFGRMQSEDQEFVNKKVNRHLKNGDMLLLNRQPTLHKPSIMGHMARILPQEKTIRMHYANCNTYNADFDGDEMNIHFPQNPLAQAEARLIMNTNNQYLVPTDGSPLRGLIQDHIVIGVLMTSKNTLLPKDKYVQLIYACLPDNGKRLKLLPPAIVKPKQLWTGKQVISTVLANLTLSKEPLNMESKSQVPGKSWSVEQVVDTEEGAVIVRDGELLTGILDKKQFGAKPNGLVHACFEVYGPDTAGLLLTTLGRLFTMYSQMTGFTCRVDDLIVKSKHEELRRQKIKTALEQGEDILKEFAFGDDWRQKDIADTPLEKRLKKIAADKNVSAEARMKAQKTLLSLQKQKLYEALEETTRSDDKLAALDNKMKGKTGSVTTDVVKTLIPNGLFKPFPENGMQLMTTSGAKGSNVNVTQISCMLGQQELEGRRVPVMVSGKTLPSFLAFDLGPRAGGYITGRFLTGIKPQEFYFHAMAGREGLIDTAVKTARSGYLQRCLIKHLEGLKVNYDNTVRDTADGSILQFNYGEDSLDVTKSSFLNNFKFNAQNFQAFLKKYNPQAAANSMNIKKACKHLQKALSKPHKYEPTLSQYNPGRYLGSVSESFASKLDSYISRDPDGLFTKQMFKDEALLNANAFKTLMQLKYVHSLVDAGEVIGLLAAQSIGEPSTQMTLNTFHFAGHGAANMTLGIPRLREIIMTASTKPKTPLMKVAFKSDVTRDQADAIARLISKRTLDMMVQEVSVVEYLTSPKSSMMGRTRSYTINLKFGDSSEYKKEHGISSEDIQICIEKKFVKKLVSAINKELKKAQQAEQSPEGEIGVGIDVNKFGESSHALKENDGDEGESAGAGKGKGKAKDKKDVKSIVEDDDHDDEMDVDATAATRAAKRKQQSSYDGPDEEEVVPDAPDSDNEDGIVLPPQNLDQLEQLEELDNFNSQESTRARRDDIVNGNMYIVDYKFDDRGEWCQIQLELPAEAKKLLMLGMAEHIIPQCTVREIPGVNNAFVSEDAVKKCLILTTEGVNIQGMWDFDGYLDVQKIESNDVSAILKVYGVEAARKTIINEISGVFAVYGIEVDLRHLTVIADYMTFEGGYKPFNRMGIDSNVSPFAKMSFETSFTFLTNSALYADADSLKNPSARIVMGKVVDGGTGSFDVMQNLEV